MKAPEFRNLYHQLRENLRLDEPVRSTEPRVTLSADAMPLETFARWISNETGYSVVVQASLDQLPVTLDAVNEPISQVLNFAARRLGVQLTQSGNTFYVGSLRPVDRGVLVRKVSRLSSNELAGAVQVLLSDLGRVIAYTDGVLVVGDRVDVLQRIGELLDRVEAAAVDVWVIQLYMISMSSGSMADFGLDVAPALDVAYAFSTASGTLGAAKAALDGHSLSAGFTALLRASASNEAVQLTTAPMFLLLDGHRAKYSDAQKRPIPKRAVSDAGTVTTTGYDFVDVGLVIDLGVRDLGQSRCQLDLQIDSTSLLGVVEDAPITSGQSFKAVSVLNSGGVYLLGTMDRHESRKAVSGPLQAGVRQQADRSVVQVWARLYRVAGSTITLSEDSNDGKDSH